MRASAGIVRAMPMYLARGERRDAQLPLAAAFEQIETSLRATGGRLAQALLLDGGELSLTIEVPDDASLMRVTLEAAEIGVALHARPAAPRQEAEALDAAHRQRRTAREGT